MENAPIDTPESSVDSASGKKKRRKSFELGRAAVDVRQPEQDSSDQPKPEQPKESWLARFTERSKQDDHEAEAESSQEAEPVSEAEAPVDGTLSPEEKQTVVQAIAQEAAKGLPERDAEEQLEEAAGDMLVAEFYENLEQNPDIEEAAQAAAHEMGLELSYEDIAELNPDQDVTDELLDEQMNELAEPGEELVFDRTAEALPFDSSESDEEEPAVGDGSTAGAPSGAVPGAGAGGHGGGTVPPTAGGFGGPGMPFGPAGGFGGSAMPNFNTIPTTPNKPKVMADSERFDDRGSPAAFFVAGGIVGYLIGRRRGRIKTEKKLLPVQKKLEKQVEDLHWQIKAKESQIRKVAAEKVRQDGPVAIEALAAKRAAKAEQPKEASPVTIKPEKLKTARQKAPEANILHTAKAPEHIGQMLMSAEIPAAVILPKTEQQIPKPNRVEIKQTAERPAPVLSEKSVETLNRAELLQLSEQIVVEGSSLRQIYETHLLGERGLRRLVAEHLRGGDMTKALKQEITEREIDFERDPAMRDIAPSGSSSSGNGGTAVGGNSTLDQMVQKAAANLPVGSEEAAFYKARAAYEVDQSHKQKRRQQVIDVSFAGIITVLLGAVIYLFITRG